MSLQEAFSSDEWARIVGAPMLAGIAVTAADPGGLWGAIKESVAVAGSISKPDGQEGLIGEIIAAYQTSEGRDTARGALKAETKGKKPEEIVDAALEELTAASALIAAKAPEFAAEYNSWLNDIAQKVAEAGTEGGFMGFGGVKVSDAEKATLERLATALA